MAIQNRKIEKDVFLAERESVLRGWATGREVDLAEALEYQKTIPDSKRFSTALKNAGQGIPRVLLQPRAGVALLKEHIDLLQALEAVADLLPTTIDAYTRQNQYAEAQKGIDRSMAAGRSVLNGLPAVNYGVGACRKVTEALTKPVEVRHGTPDGRLLIEICLAGGFTSYEGGGISYNIPYAKKVPLEKSLRDYQYCDRLVGIYEEAGVRINREAFGPLTGTLNPPFITHAVGIIEGLLALEQGVRCITLGYGQLGNLVQDIAAMISLRELADEFFTAAGYSDYALSTALHQWMGAFPADEALAFGVIALGSTVAAMTQATKVIVKTPHEASGIPTKEANLQGLRASRQVVNMLRDQPPLVNAAIKEEVEVIKREVRHLLARVFELGDGDIALGTVRAFEAGVIDVPFAPALCNAGKLMPVRDNNGAVRVLELGKVPMEAEVFEIHREKIARRSRHEGREPSYRMLVDDINGISKGQLVGRP